MQTVHKNMEMVDQKIDEKITNQIKILEERFPKSGNVTMSHGW